MDVRDRGDSTVTGRHSYRWRTGTKPRGGRLCRGGCGGGAAEEVKDGLRAVVAAGGSELLEVPHHLPDHRAARAAGFDRPPRTRRRPLWKIVWGKTFSEWRQVFGDELLATAILDRLLHHCDVVSVNGPSYRLKNRLAALERDTNVA